MRSRSTRLTLILLLMSGTLLLAACSADRSTLPTGVNASVSANRIAPSGRSCDEAAERQIVALFRHRDLGRAIWGFHHVVEDLRERPHTDAVTDMFHEWEFTLNSYYAGRLRGGTSTNTQTATLAFGRALYCLVGLDGSTLTLDTSPLDPNNVVKVVFPSPSSQTVVTGSQHAGVVIPGGTLSQPVTISIALLPGAYTFPAGPLNTKLDQYGPFFEFRVVPQQTFNTPVLAAACIQSPSGNLPSSVDIAHNVGTGIELLPTHPVSFLLCGGTGLAPQPSAFELARSGDYGDAVKRLGSMALSMLTPTSAYAFSTGIGGTTTSFSPFGGVDTAVVVRLPSTFPAQPQSAPAGSPIASPPSVLIQTANGHTPLGGAAVTLTITTGGGSLGPATSSTRTTTATATSDNTTGLASVPNWTLGVGPNNALTANASFVLPTNISGFPTSGSSAGAGVTVSGNPVNFSALSTDVLPYQAAGFTFLSGATGIAPGFEQPSYQATPQNGWQPGTGAFGSPNLGASCPSLASTVGTLWPNNPSGTTDMLLRKSFSLPAWWTAGLTIGVAIDNDFQAFVDGVNITPSSNSPGHLPGDFATHDGCATRDSFTFPSPVTAGMHVLAIRARDRGTAAYVDTRISVTP